MEQPTYIKPSSDHLHRLSVLMLLIGLAVGMALLTICLALLTTPVHGTAKSDRALIHSESTLVLVASLNESKPAGAVIGLDRALLSELRSTLTTTNVLTPILRTTAASDVLVRLSSLVTMTTAPRLEPGWFSSDLDETISIAWGDVDNDGDLDLVAGNDGPNKVYLNVDGMLQVLAAWTSQENDKTLSVAWGDVDGDGDLDLAVGNDGPNRLYLNVDGTLETQAAWSSLDSGPTYSVAWGDMNGDGHLDLAAGNGFGHNRVYINLGSELQTYGAWTERDIDDTRSIAWGDVDGDGDLDLAAGVYNGPNKVYLNAGGMLEMYASWVSLDSDATFGVAWGDMDSDGDLDLAAGGISVNKIYLNVGDTLQPQAAWVSSDGDYTHSVAWGDVDGDGDLDLATGNLHSDNVYLNVDGTLETQAVWTSGDRAWTWSVAWGDMDSDGDLDLAAGNRGTNQVYLNAGTAVRAQAAWVADTPNRTRSIAWGDVDGDGDLDLAAGNEGESNQVYINEDGLLQSHAGWNSADIGATYSVAWADMDGDGDLDLAAGNRDTSNKVYLNAGAALQTQATWASDDSGLTSAIAWGDVDRDGDLDLAAGNYGRSNRVYVNVDGMLQTQAAWASADADSTTSIAWGDIDGDGDLDLAAGTYNGPSKVYLNDSGALGMQPVWISADRNWTYCIAWGDMDGDGDLDLAAGNDGPNKVYQNIGGMLQVDAVWASADSDDTLSVAWGDVDGDGDLDLVAGNDDDPNRIYLNVDGMLQSQAVWASCNCDWTTSIALGDMDGDGNLDVATGNYFSVNKVYLGGRPMNPLNLSSAPAVKLGLSSDLVPTFNSWTAALAPTDYYGLPGIRDSGSIPISYTLFHPTSETVRSIRAFFSPDGSMPDGRMNWPVAVPAAGVDTTDLTTSPYPTPTIANTHAYTWDVLGSGFMGQSDNVIVRIEALPNHRPTANGVAGPFLRPYVSSQTFRFRVRGSQVKVMQGDDPVQGAIVYRLPAGQTGGFEPYRDGFGAPYRTQQSGFLEGYGAIGLYDRLVALAPITATESYTLYYASGPPTPGGIDPYIVSALGVQTLTVSPANPLVLFNLNMSLEWDARNDPSFMAQLTQDIRRASEVLYDWSNGQAALGKVTIYHAKQHWQDAHVLIYASNRFRPAAMQGGVISDIISETVSPGTSSVITYLSGQLAMGPVWNRYGDPGSNLGEDWPRVFAHELGHYALFLDDNYIGLDDDNLLMPVDSCPGAMADPYRDDAASGYGEFHPVADWLPECQHTLSNRNTSRADWQTIGVFYPSMFTDQTNPGPSVLPLAVTEVAVVEPVTPTTTLDAPFFLLVQDGNRVFPDTRSRSYLFQDGWAIDLGTPSQDRLLARGARPGDRLCIYDLGASRLGCETIASGDTEIALSNTSEWSPEIFISPVTSVTLAISITNIPPGLSLAARLYPLGEPFDGEIELIEDGVEYIGAFELDSPALVGVIQVWVNEPGQRREIVTDYVLGGNPGRIWSGGGRIWSGGGRIWSGGGRIWSGGAPVASADGQVVVYSPSHQFSREWFLTVQASAIEPPLWATLVGKTYRVSASNTAPDLMDMSIAFSYLGSDVPPGEEPWLRVYFWNGSTWTQLATRLDTSNNLASAAVVGVGVYALMSSIEIPLDTAGWHMIGYPILDTRPVTEALISISGYYTTVHGYDSGLADPFQRWRTYDVVMPHALTTLDVLEFAKGYYINVSQPVTIYLKGAAFALDQSHSLNEPPATYFGVIDASIGLTPTAGMPVTAWINGRLCGRSLAQVVDDDVMVAINVLSSGSGVAAGCGQTGQPVSFRIAGMAVTPGVQWDNSNTRQLTFRRCPDFDGSGTVDIADVIAVTEQWELQHSALGWQEQYDWDGDGDVDILDVQQVTALWESSCSTPTRR